MKLIQQPVDSFLFHMLKKEGSLFVKQYITKDGMRILYTADKTHHGILKHFSVSRTDRYPGWDEIVKIKEELMGDIDTMMVIPKKENYVNESKNCFHVWETPTAWDIK